MAVKDQPDVMVCVFWGEQSIPCVKLQCSQCQAAVALDKDNLTAVITKKIQVRCTPCAAKLYFELGLDLPIAQLVDGEKMELDPKTKAKAIRYLERRR